MYFTVKGKETQRIFLSVSQGWNSANLPHGRCAGLRVRELWVRVPSLLLLRLESYLGLEQVGEPSPQIVCNLLPKNGFHISKWMKRNQKKNIL